MKKLVILSGAGISAESGISTFRDSNGLWENHKIEEVASPEGFEKNPDLVQHFYNLRRKQLLEVSPNPAHTYIAELEKWYDVTVVTQNVDDLHERAGSSKVLHLHGELRKVRSVMDSSYIIPWDKDLKTGDLCPKGGQLRPHIVWFGEDVPVYPKALEIVKKSDILVIIGTSLQVYPAAGLLGFAPKHCKLFVIDPNANELYLPRDARVFVEKASVGMEQLFNELKINT